MNSVTLFELNEFIRRVLALNLPEALWVRCELAEVKSSRGHWYLQLVQKGEGESEVAAQGQAVIWNRTYNALLRKFGIELEALLRDGVEVMFLAKVDYHERYGLKLVIEDFDPAYSMGKLELKRREIIRQLQQLNLLEKQKLLRLPPVLQNLDVVTSESAAGYQDFLDQLDTNSFGYRFNPVFFQTAMQGSFVEQEMLAQLQKIRNRAGEFDAAVIIRGGGAKLDLAAFDNLALGKAVANFPLPVLTGIGHDVDETVLDLVAHSSLKTPTAVADFILNRNMQFESGVLNLALELKNRAVSFVNKQEIQLRHTTQLIDYQIKSKFRQQGMMLNYIEKEIPAVLKHFFKKEKIQLLTLENTVTLLSPETALKRGFGIVLKNGKPVVAASEVQPGEDLEILLRKGRIVSTVKQVKDE